MVGCSGGSKDTKDTAESDATAFDEPKTARDSIEQMLNEAMTRLRYTDKSALYENEFSYLTDTTTFDDYLKTGQMRYANADTLTRVDVTDIQLFGHDSAEVGVIVNFEGPTGEKHQLPDRIIVYYHKGRWIKPTISVIKHQQEYDVRAHHIPADAL